jgi:hypothetical protein
MEKIAVKDKDLENDRMVSFHHYMDDFFEEPIDETEDDDADLAVERHEKVKKDVPLEEPPIEDEVLIHDIDVEEGEVEAHEYRLAIPPDLQARLGDPAVDHSYTALMYLHSLGYDRVDFMLNPAEDREYDICDELAKISPWSLEHIVARAGDDATAKGYPIAPLFWMSHPGCLCYLFVYAPDSPDEIPDNAPGLHMWADEERLLAEKEELWNTLPSIVEVDSLTMGPDVFEAVKEITSKDNSRTKISNKNWVEEIKPIQIKENIYVKQPVGLIQIINKDAKGFQLEINNEIAKVFLYEFGREIYIPINSYSILNLSLSNKTNPDEGDFMVADEEGLAIAYGMLDDELLVYDPEYNNIVRIDDWKVLETV